jgi:hypothetical protein
MESDTIIEVIDKLIGPINPTGTEAICHDHNTNIENIEKLIDITGVFINRLIEIEGKYKGHAVYNITSMMAKDFLSGIGIPEE